MMMIPLFTMCVRSYLVSCRPIPRLIVNQSAHASTVIESELIAPLRTEARNASDDYVAVCKDVILFIQSINPKNAQRARPGSPDSRRLQRLD